MLQRSRITKWLLVGGFLVSVETPLSNRLTTHQYDKLGIHLCNQSSLVHDKRHDHELLEGVV